MNTFLFLSNARTIFFAAFSVPIKKGLNSTGSPEFSTYWTFLGMPSISLPLLSGLNNLPLGVQLIGEKFDDARRMRTANWLMKKNKNV